MKTDFEITTIIISIEKNELKTITFIGDGQTVTKDFDMSIHANCLNLDITVFEF